MMTMTEPIAILAAESGNTLSLHRKLAQVMFEVERIPKNGTAPQAMGGFKFVQVGDAADVIRKALAEQGVTMIPASIELVGESEHPTSSGKMMTTMTVRTTWILTDGDTGETATIQSLGSGADMGDKAAPKAQSNAMKYALLMGFLLSTGDDPEMSDSSDRRPPPRAAEQRPVGQHDTPPDRPELVREVHDGLIGTFATSGTQDAQLRETPDGWVLPFRLKAGAKAGQICIAHDSIAQAIANRGDLMGARVTVWGTYTDESVEKVKDGKPFTIGYKVLHVARLVGEGFDLTAADPHFVGSDESEHAGGGLSDEEQADMDALPW